MSKIEELEDLVRVNIESILQGGFFARLRTTPITLAGYQVFVKQKYGSVSYFVDFLKKGIELSTPHSKKIATVFQENYNDEVGCFAGTIREEYSHENWRLRSLKEFGIEKDQLQGNTLFPCVIKHQDILTTLPKSESFFELVGALLFNELFVSNEMRELIHAFERDLPDLFPPGGYDYKHFPNNTEEYWYNHALHDLWHFKQIREALQTYVAEHEISESDLKMIEQGINKVFEAKSSLYSEALFNELKASGEE